MKNSNLAMHLEEFAEVIGRIDSPDEKMPHVLTAAANTEMRPQTRAIPARRRIQTRDQGLRPFRVF